MLFKLVFIFRLSLFYRNRQSDRENGQNGAATTGRSPAKVSVVPALNILRSWQIIEIYKVNLVPKELVLVHLFIIWDYNNTVVTVWCTDADETLSMYAWIDLYCTVCRDGPEQPDSHLIDLLEQLTSVNAARPSERDFIRQGKRRVRQTMLYS